MTNDKVTVKFRLIYKSAKFSNFQLSYAGEPLTIKNKRTSAKVTPGEYRLLRWYAVSGSPEEAFTVRIVPPPGHRLRYPTVPVAKVDPDITGKMPKTPGFKDLEAWRRIKIEVIPAPAV